MSDATQKLWYYIDGKRSLSSVFVSPNETIDHLKEKIFKKAPNSFIRCDAADLILTKVRYIMTSMNADVINNLCWPMTTIGRCGLWWDSG